MTNPTEKNGTTSSGNIRVRMKSVHVWRRTWKNLVVEPDTQGDVVEQDGVRGLYSVLWDKATEPVWVARNDVERIFPGDTAMVVTPQGSRMFK
jgi:hypothetical protein